MRRSHQWSSLSAADDVFVDQRSAPLVVRFTYPATSRGKMGSIRARDDDVILTNTEDVAELLEELMAIDSTSGSEAKLGRAISLYLQSRGWWIVRQSVSHGLEDRFNVLATREPYTDKEQPTLVLNTHLDTVPPYIPPARNDTILRGRGSCDAKAMIAAMITAANKIVRDSPKIAEKLALLFTVSEENGHYGMMEANKLNLKPRYLIVGEPTEMKFAVGHKGVLSVGVRCHGTACHSGYPHKGESAIDKLLDVLQDLRHTDWPVCDTLGATTMNIGVVSGGQAVNALAAHAEARLLFRVVNPVLDLIDQIKQVLAGRADITIGSSCSSPTHLVAPADAPQTVVAFGTDAPYLQSPKTQTYLYGPGSIMDAHSDWEYIQIADLRQSVAVYHELAIELLTRSGSGSGNKRSSMSSN